jgi:hypothetical protein
MGSPFGNNNSSTSGGIAQAWLTFVQTNLSGQIILLVAVAVVGAILFGLRYLLRQRRLFNLPLVTGVLLAFLLVSSSGWWINVAQAQSTQTTASVSGFPGGPGGGMGSGQTNQQLIQYLEANQGDYKYLVAVSNSQSAASIIIETGLPVMSIGGFTGSDKTITSTAQLQEMIANHTVRYFMLGGGGGPGGGSTVVSEYVQQNCQLVDSSLYSTSSASSSGSGTTTGNATTATDGARAGGGFGGQQQQLYVCGG